MKTTVPLHKISNDSFRDDEEDDLPWSHVLSGLLERLLCGGDQDDGVWALFNLSQHPAKCPMSSKDVQDHPQ